MPLSLTALFPSGFETILFVSIILLWVCLEIIGGVIIPRLRGGDGAIKRNDAGSNLVLRVSLYLSILIAALLAGNKITMLPGWLFYPGIFLMIVGILVRQWAIFILGRFFTLTVSVQKNQSVVDSGPYRFIRHPSYLGMYLILMGMGIALQSWGGILVIAVLSGLAIGYRIHVEETFLVAELGNDYVEYMKRTKRLIPFVF